MKLRLLLLSMLVFINIAFGQDEKAQKSPLEVVNKRMKLYNQHDFDQFIKLYAKDVKVYTYPDKLLGDGIENIISIFKPKFETKSISVKIINQIENGSHVVNHEIVTENGLLTKYVSIYQVENGLIKSVRFVRDN
ncbi:nuclear transport factor 2 family protein [Ichthyenterobacterium sp. W332]|uniref:Nuclear transport factor 2 family protein n=1 Tax=Microcosmobacter mediterraneus TaxID=3075607 RepID=A0ABU2YN04_9FLAO|nr:nuclear transport factor 2 family protein [Ichthyenterobacterium sp. W332]MDT0559551.1 nuclear transport factor 2 family protein [Ichthyenterobacterium sp. W332]